MKLKLGVLGLTLLAARTTNVANAWVPSKTTTTTPTKLFAAKQLTERQLQFWEDVEDGLNDVESFYNKEFNKDDSESATNNSIIQRIRDFATRASNGNVPPQDVIPGHQPSEEHVDGLTAKPFWDVVSEPQLFPWAAELEANANIIAQEFEDKLNRDGQMFASDSAWQNQVMGEGWSAVRLQRLGVWNMDNVKEFPKTYELLRKLNIPLAVRGVCFARQGPGSGVQPHSDGRNFILTSHLGLKVPTGSGGGGEGCWIQVGTERSTWEEGKLLTLDTSFEHSTGNPTQEERHVLIIDFWHPELTQAERAGLEFVYDLRNKFESGKIPFRKPRSLQQEEEGQGLAGLWKAITGGGDDDS
mmetsp:Transcript_14772/g.20876  ORF Transcript_14772/g.20876 Transcript_14772/m.20876 type:complete len:357 (+) Transcript_14772:152-1222(+)